MRICVFNRNVLGLSACAAFLAGCAGGVAPPNPATPLSNALRTTTAERGRASGSYGVLYSFGTGSGDGLNPYAGLINVNGTLYGTTAYGGTTDGTGAVFAISKAGTETVVHRFGGSGDGSNPFAPLLDIKGALYGTTFAGGTTQFGTVFAISKSGKESILHNFGLAKDGDWPEAGLVDAGGTLYGTTADGGTNSVGTVFAISKTGNYKVLHMFAGGSGDGSVPYDGLLSVKGTLYGTTQYGGLNDAGTVFSMTTSGAVTVLHSFGGPGDGGYPLAGLVDVKGTLYGTTVTGGASCGSKHLTGCGVVFSITPSGTETVVHSFGSSSDGVYPYAGLVNVHGVLYGTTAAGGSDCSPYGCGVVFSITTSGKEAVLHSFSNTPDGAYTSSSLLDVKGTLYGTTVNGGTDGNGTVFWLKP